mmetsp:Transcript_66877/g.192253  ORF Transcript_66877/g.192253 Transcript_66877/m.192253 type:complete len:316 (+) Transcript_66877:334-1281(+)
MFLLTESNFCLAVALSLTKMRRKPTISSLMALTPAAWLLCVACGSPSSKCVSCLSSLHCSPSLCNLPVKTCTCWINFSSAGFVVSICSCNIETSRERCSVCDFWSKKWRCSSVSISLYAFWICADTSCISSPMLVSSKLLTSISVMETKSGTWPEPLHAVKPMKPPARTGVVGVILKHSFQARLGDCFKKPSIESGLTRILTVAGFKVLRKSMSLAFTDGTSLLKSNSLEPSFAMNDIVGFLDAPLVENMVPKPSNFALPPANVKPCCCMPALQLSALITAVSLYTAVMFSWMYQKEKLWSSGVLLTSFSPLNRT